MVPKLTRGLEGPIGRKVLVPVAVERPGNVPKSGVDGVGFSSETAGTPGVDKDVLLAAVGYLIGARK